MRGKMAPTEKPNRIPHPHSGWISGRNKQTRSELFNVFTDTLGEGKYHPGRNYYKIIPWNNYFCNSLCNYYKTNSTRAFSLYCCCHWFVPVCKRTCEGIGFVKRLFHYFLQKWLRQLLFFEKCFCTLWHEIITKIIPWELFFVMFETFCRHEVSRKERHFQGITYENRNFPEISISE